MILSVQNTGSNVLIQNSTTINVSVEQAHSFQAH
jgi:hypothetical protein